jgi:hypothetical protein
MRVTKRFWAICNLIGLIGGFVGGILLVLALEVIPSDFRLIHPREGGGVALCLGDRLVQNGYGGPLVTTDEPCPPWKSAGPIAQINVHKPAYAYIGLRLVILGFILQVPAAITALTETRVRPNSVPEESSHPGVGKVDIDKPPTDKEPEHDR